MPEGVGERGSVGVRVGRGEDRGEDPGDGRGDRRGESSRERTVLSLSSAVAFNG